jgi:acyl carrier protein
VGLFIEPSVRRLVAERLGVDANDLMPAVSLRGDLAADSLDLIDLTVALETTFAITVPDRVMDRAGTYGELVEAMGRLIRARRDDEAHAAECPPVCARITPRTGVSRTAIEHFEFWTPYAAQTLVDDALRAGCGARVDVTVATTSAACCARVRQSFTRAVDHGVEIHVRRDDHPPAPVVDGATATRVAVADDCGDGAWRVPTEMPGGGAAMGIDR